MAQQIAVKPDATAQTRIQAGGPSSLHEVLPDLAYQRMAIVNVIFVGSPQADWVLVDAGVLDLPGTILDAAAARFGKESRPRAIVLTHGHFDHVGSLRSLAERWDVPIYAHQLEIPYLSGSASYPPPDPAVGGGLMSYASGLYPRGPIDVSRWLQVLPADQTVPALPGWSWIHVPGHTPGQIALWRSSDGTLLAADAFITTAQESAYAVLKQEPELHGPPKYYTQDWVAARESVQRLARLQPELVVSGHGPPLRGPSLRTALDRLAEEFDQVAVPRNGAYVRKPSRVEDGDAYRPRV